MAKIHAPNEEYTGVIGGVAFANGVAETDDKRMIEWFREHGYGVGRSSGVDGRELVDAADPPDGVEIEPGDEAPPPPVTDTGVEQQPVPTEDRPGPKRRS